MLLVEDAIIVGLMSRDEIPEDITRILGNSNREIIDHLIRDLVENSLNKKYLSFSKLVLKALKSLLEFNYNIIYYAPVKQRQNTKIEQMFRLMFQSLLKQIDEGDKTSRIFLDFLNTMDDNYIEKTPPARAVIDFISGMTDDYFLSTFKALFLPEGYGLKLDRS